MVRLSWPSCNIIYFNNIVLQFIMVIVLLQYSNTANNIILFIISSKFKFMCTYLPENWHILVLSNRYKRVSLNVIYIYSLCTALYEDKKAFSSPASRYFIYVIYSEILLIIIPNTKLFLIPNIQQLNDEWSVTFFYKKTL